MIKNKMSNKIKFKNTNTKNKNELMIYGKQPVLLTILNKKRQIFKIYTSNKKELCDFINKNDIKFNIGCIEERTNRELDNLTIDNEVNHQGYIAIVGSRSRINFDIFCNEICKDKNNLPKLLILDEVTDPRNVGAIMRTAAAFGVNYIISTYRNSVNDSGTIIKSSAGYSEVMELIEVGNLNQAMEDLKKVGYFIIGLAGETKQDIKSIKDSKNLCLVLGNEGRGIRQLVKKNCDSLYRIEMQNNVESLNVSVACAIAIYQLWS